jgi:hypothetical protein
MAALVAAIAMRRTSTDSSIRRCHSACTASRRALASARCDNSFAIGLGSHNDALRCVVVVRAGEALRSFRQQLASCYHDPLIAPNKYVARCVVCLLFVCSRRRRGALLQGWSRWAGHPQNLLAFGVAEVLTAIYGNPSAHIHQPRLWRGKECLSLIQRHSVDLDTHRVE